MVLDWVKSETARRAISYFADPRPAWLWSAKGDNLLWHNPAARLFRAKQKRHGLKLSSGAVPIKGQVSRNIRLGSNGRASLSRMQFLAGKKPVSATCTCTPLKLEDGTKALLIVAVDPIDKEIFSTHGMTPDILAGLFGDNDYVLADAEGEAIAASIPDAAFDPSDDTLQRIMLDRGLELVFLPTGYSAPETVATEEAPRLENPESSTDEHGASVLSTLVDRLADDSALYDPLGPEDDNIPEGLEVPIVATVEETSNVAEDRTDESPDTEAEEDASEGPELWRVVGREFTADDDAGAASTPEQKEASEIASRYNFEELSRILNDRVGGDTERQNVENLPASAPTQTPLQAAQGELVSLGDETLVLNRLPIGIMIFREQEILFANRTLTDLVGFPDSTSLRAQGISAIFPETSAENSGVGPVTHLLHTDGSNIPVSARLQTVTWQGKAAFMLSAKQQENVDQSREGAIRDFAEGLAALNGSGFFETSRAGIIDSVSGRAAELFGRSPEVLIGRPMILLAGHAETAKLRAFLEHPFSHSDAARPSLMLKGFDPQLQILLFAEGQAGLTTGYFGIVQRLEAQEEPRAGRPQETGVEPSILKRLSRGMRRPLNTIVGFSELIRGTAFGPIENPRYVEYARDIKSAGQEILHVVDELEELIRLQTGEYDAVPDDIDLTAVLDKSMSRVRKQAGEARVLVRSAISERLPHIRADEPSLTQAILNLLASAIDQTPEGGQVVLSAQYEQDGSIAIHVRDSGTLNSDLAERFVVFRDGTDQNGDVRKPIHSSVGLALTKSLLEVNTCSLSIDPTAGPGTLSSLVIPGALTIDRN